MLLAVCLLAGAAAASAQKSPGGLAATVILGTMAGERGTTVSIPVYLQEGGEAVSRLSLTVDFVSNSVRFDKADSGGVAESDAQTLVVRPEQLPAGENGLPRTRLRIEAAARPGAKALAAGLLAFLNFTIAQDAKSVSVSLQPGELAGDGVTGAALNIAAEPGKVIVSADDEPQVGCFFFTH